MAQVNLVKLQRKLSVVNIYNSSKLTFRFNLQSCILAQCGISDITLLPLTVFPVRLLVFL